MDMLDSNLCWQVTAPTAFACAVSTSLAVLGGGRYAKKPNKKASRVQRPAIEISQLQPELHLEDAEDSEHEVVAIGRAVAGHIVPARCRVQGGVETITL